MLPGRITRLIEKRVASAATITADADVIALTGTTTIETINPRASLITDRGGQLVFLLALDGTVVLGVTDNIAVAASVLQNRCLPLIYSAITGHWHPIIVA